MSNNPVLNKIEEFIEQLEGQGFSPLPIQRWAETQPLEKIAGRTWRKYNSDAKRILISQPYIRENTDNTDVVLLIIPQDPTGTNEVIIGAFTKGKTLQPTTMSSYQLKHMPARDLIKLVGQFGSRAVTAARTTQQITYNK